MKQWNLPNYFRASKMHPQEADEINQTTLAPQYCLYNGKGKLQLTLTKRKIKSNHIFLTQTTETIKIVDIKGKGKHNLKLLISIPQSASIKNRFQYIGGCY